MGVAGRIGVLCSAALLAGCAADGRGPPRGFDDEEGGPPRAQLFVSPSGQPFRSAPGQPYPSAAWFAAADADRDGRLTRAEFRADADAWFKALDADGDGQLSMPEATRWEEDLVPEVSRVGPGGAGRGMAVGRNELNTRIQGAAAYSLISEPHPVRGADIDLDYRVTRTEWRVAADRRFGLLDPDGDGAVLAADMRATPAQAMAMPRRPSLLRREAVGPRR